MRPRESGPPRPVGKHSRAPRPGRTREWVGELLGAWQQRELRVARGYPECRGLGHAQLEDLYQETVLALLQRAYASERHLRAALRNGIRNRARNLHRDRRRRSEILAQHAPSIQRLAEARAREHDPEHSTVRTHELLAARQFLAELDQLERRVFALLAEGLRHRAIALQLGIEVNEARRAERRCEQKRERFHTRYEARRARPAAHGAQAAGGGATSSAASGPKAT